MSETDMSVWRGRDDGPGAEHARWFNTINDLNAPTQQPETETGPGLALIGFASDEGVRRNQGRIGATEGPRAIREALGSFAIHTQTPLYDAGDVNTGADLEAGQAEFGQRLAQALSAGHRTVGLGGGHEITWASYQGIAQALGLSNQRLGIINLDAHFDNREAEHATSGTGFTQIHQAETQAGRNLKALAIGIAEHANTRALFERARAQGIDWILDEHCQTRHLDGVIEQVRGFITEVDAIYLTVDLDVLPAAVAPGVSAPAALGMPQEVFEAIIDAVRTSRKLVHVDIAELNPNLDEAGRTAKIAARIVQRLAHT